jgi:hypothetical protein
MLDDKDVTLSSEYQEHLPITQFLMGLLKNSHLDIQDYEEYLENKYKLYLPSIIVKKIKN